MLGRKLGKLVFDSKSRADNYVLTRQARRDWYITEQNRISHNIDHRHFCVTTDKIINGVTLAFGPHIPVTAVYLSLYVYTSVYFIERP